MLPLQTSVSSRRWRPRRRPSGSGSNDRLDDCSASCNKTLKLLYIGFINRFILYLVVKLCNVIGPRQVRATLDNIYPSDQKRRLDRLKDELLDLLCCSKDIYCHIIHYDQICKHLA
jgi:hypothetical protein